MTTDNGGSAFPIVLYPDSREYHPGMSLRDYFAAKAMQGLIMSTVNGDERTLATMLHVFADLSYGIADSMLTERAK